MRKTEEEIRRQEPEIAQQDVAAALRQCKATIVEVEDLLMHSHNNDPWDVISDEDRKQLARRWRQSRDLFDKFVTRHGYLFAQPLAEDG
jgi:hypothetical protein